MASFPISLLTLLYSIVGSFLTPQDFNELYFFHRLNLFLYIQTYLACFLQTEYNLG